jgi:hypothetical protein
METRARETALQQRSAKLTPELNELLKPVNVSSWTVRQLPEHYRRGIK